ncbi:MAG: hypothetical protein FWG65_08000 [Turicibacter sp.]|nr:hypothetical protein [Turicibacter sp.]
MSDYLKMSNLLLSSKRKSFQKQLREGDTAILENFIGKGVVTEILSDAILRKLEYEKAISLIESIPLDTLNTREWQSANLLSGMCGMVRLGLEMRKKAIESAYHVFDSGNFSADDLRLAFQAALDRNDSAKARYILENHTPVALVNGESFTYNSKKGLQTNFATSLHWQAYLEVFEGNLTEASQLIHIISPKPEYLNYISGKTVAIVGPAYSEVEQGAEIDSYDVIVRLNYMGKASTAASSLAGSRTDVAYYADGIFNRQKDKSFLTDLNYWFSRSGKVKMSDIAKNYGGIAQYWEIFFSNVRPQMVQRALLSLLLCNPIRIKIFCANFHSAKKHYADEYIRKLSNQVYRINNSPGLPSVLWYDVAVLLNFIRNLWKNKIVEADLDCERVLKMTNEDYCSLMEELYPRED